MKRKSFVKLQAFSEAAGSDTEKTPWAARASPASRRSFLVPRDVLNCTISLTHVQTILETVVNMWTTLTQ